MCTVYHTAVYRVDLKSAQDRGLVFRQTNSNAIILSESVPADCLEDVINLEPETFCIKRFDYLHDRHPALGKSSVMAQGDLPRIH